MSPARMLISSGRSSDAFVKGDLFGDLECGLHKAIPLIKLGLDGASSNGQVMPCRDGALSLGKVKCPVPGGLSRVDHGRWREATSSAISRMPTSTPTNKPSTKPSTVHGVYSRKRC